MVMIILLPIPNAPLMEEDARAPFDKRSKRARSYGDVQSGDELRPGSESD